MKSRKRFIAKLLIASLAASSIQFPTVDVQAQELYQEMEEMNDVTEDEEVVLEVQESESDTDGGSNQKEYSDIEETDEREEDSDIEDADELTKDSADQDSLEDSENPDETDAGEDLENEDSASEVPEDDSWEVEEENESLQSLLSTSGDDIASGTYTEDGSNTAWVIDKNGKLTVTGTGEVERDYGLFMPWRKYWEQIKTAEIRVSGMTDASGMFDECRNLIEVDVRGFDTSNVTNMDEMFSGCISLKELNVSGFNTSNVTSMDHMFFGCESLTELDVRGFDTRNVTNMRDMFSYCSSLAALNLNGLDVSNVTDMSGMFFECSSLKELDLSGFDTSNATDMNAMFGYCSSLTKLNLNDWDTSNVTNMGCMFTECRSLKELDLSGFDTSNVTEMCSISNGMFSYCSSLTKLDLTGFDTRNVTSMENMFFDCENLTELDLSSFEMGNVTSMEDMFGNCSSLTKLDLSGFDTRNVTSMEDMFGGCSSLTELDVSGWDTGNVTNMWSMFYSCSSLLRLDLSDFETSSVTDMAAVFAYCSSLEAIYTPRNVKVSASLPTAKNTDIWYRADTGETLTELPQGLSYSILLGKNKVPDLPRLSVTKVKTAYQCGETINLEDLKVTYYDLKGVRTEITEGYSTNVQDIDINIPGKKMLEIFYEGLKAEVELTFTFSLTEEFVSIQMLQDSIYNGYPQTPNVTVTIHMDGVNEASETDRTLILGTDYTVSYTNNINAGEEAEVIITGTGDYSGTVKKNFAIAKAALIITASDVTLAIGDFLPDDRDYKYQLDGLVLGDELLKEPSFNCDIADTKELGIYSIIPSGADAGSNYEITYRSGTLTVAEERVIYTVTFDLLGHGADIDSLTGIKAGCLISEPETLKEGDIATEENISYIFTGWYKDKTFAAKQKWNFATDTVQADTTLYACWLTTASGADTYGANLCVQEIADQTYTGNAIKPNVIVYSGDGSTLLKAGKDYTVKYYNNKEADTEKELAKGGTGGSVSDNSAGFTTEPAYVVITGKGNYRGTIYRNFHILPASISAEDENKNMTLASGFSLKYTEQLTINKNKAQKPFTSLKYKKAMKAGTDYEVTLTALEAYDAEGNPAQNADGGVWTVIGSTADKYIPAIPKGYSGSFLMTVTGKGNYSGSFTKTIIVSDKSRLMKNVSVSIGKNIKTQKYDNGKELTLTPGYYDKTAKEYYKFTDRNGSRELVEDTKGIFTIKAGNNYLVYGKDYNVSYTNNKAVGTATMTITGMGDYMGGKSVTFKITGTAFNTKNIIVKADDSNNLSDTDEFVTSMSYTGKALTQNKVTLTTKATNDTPAKLLVYGTHYTISYKNNIKKGRATMTFTAKPESGYSGSFKKTFKITSQSLLDVKFNEENSVKDEISDKDKNTKSMTWSGATPVYSKNGATLSFILKNAEGMGLKQGIDYTVSYKNNKAATAGNDNMENQNPPTLIIRGKGNYAGTLTVTFPIQKADIKTALENGSLAVSATPIAKKDNMKFSDFKFKVLDGKKVLSAGDEKDYILDETKCTPEIIKAYAEALSQKKETGSEIAVQEPTATIKGTGNYTGEKEISLADYIYITKLTGSSVYVVVSEDTAQTTYTGEQVTPEVAVYYGTVTAVKAAKKDKESDETKLTDASGKYGLTKLKLKSDMTENSIGDYTLTYGKNLTAGKNKGSVTITGTGIYGGRVTVKFTIISKDVYTTIN